jgi:hypothetical protein
LAVGSAKHPQVIRVGDDDPFARPDQQTSVAFLVESTFWFRKWSRFEGADFECHLVSWPHFLNTRMIMLTAMKSWSTAEMK